MGQPIPAYPLHWPEGWRRSTSRTRAKFSAYKNPLSINDAIQRVRHELSLFGVSEAYSVVTTNVALRLDGWPRSDLRMPDDPGVSVYWTRVRADGMKCMAIDIYDRVADNIAAVAATIAAMRAIERHGGAVVLERAFTGFTALPRGKSWREIFGFAADEVVQELRLLGAYRTARSEAHPDKGGSQDAFIAVVGAYKRACEELGYAVAGS